MKWPCILVLCLACSLPTRRPALVVTATRNYCNRTARGEARVFAAGSVHTRLAAARAWLAMAVAFSPAPVCAYQAAIRGAHELGPDYAARGVREETRVKEMTAMDEHAAGRDQLAAHLMVSVLRSRIAMYERRYAAEVD